MLGAYVQLLRPPQWVKNVFVFAGPIFARRIFEPAVLGRALITFVGFCLLASAVYVINDVADRQEDRLHPRKRYRPVAAEVISPGSATLLAGVLLVVSLTVLFYVSPGVMAVGLTYLVLMLVYSWVLKHKMILDVIAISLGFVLRALAGAVAVPVAVSPWLITCTFTLCLFLGFSKRRCELAAFADVNQASLHRSTLLGYTTELLNHLLSVSAGIAVVTFLLYCMDERTVKELGTNYLIYTAPLVVYGVFRYAMLVESGQVSGPTDVVVNDVPFIATVLVWAVLAGLIVYAGSDLQDWIHRWLLRV
jgi:4-hydroxybenzoate polyprenyltransferase